MFIKIAETESLSLNGTTYTLNLDYVAKIMTETHFPKELNGVKGQEECKKAFQGITEAIVFYDAYSVEIGRQTFSYRAINEGAVRAAKRDLFDALEKNLGFFNLAGYHGYLEALDKQYNGQ